MEPRDSKLRNITISVLKILVTVVFFIGLPQMFFSPDLTEFRRSGQVYQYLDYMAEFSGWEMLKSNGILIMLSVIVPGAAIILLEIIGRPRPVKAAFSFITGGWYLSYLIFFTSRYITPEAQGYIERYNYGDWGWHYKYSHDIHSYREGFWICAACAFILIVLSAADAIITGRTEKETHAYKAADKNYLFILCAGSVLCAMSLPFTFFRPELTLLLREYGQTTVEEFPYGPVSFTGFMLFKDNIILAIICCLALAVMFFVALRAEAKNVQYITSVVCSLTVFITTIIYALNYIEPTYGPGYRRGGREIYPIGISFWGKITSQIEITPLSLSVGFWLFFLGIAVITAHSVMRIVKIYKNKPLNQ